MPPATRVLMLFVDGIGLGPAAEPEINPFNAVWKGLEAMAGGERWLEGRTYQTDEALFQGIDACLGMDGLPQSGTGQASLFTGVNCAALAGRHYGPYPHSATRDTIRELSLFARVGASHSTFVNAYPPRFFKWVERMSKWPVTTRACLDAGVRIRTLEDLENGLGVAADVTGHGLAKHLGLDVTVISPDQAADRMLHLTSEHRFTLFEMFHTDKAGHAQDAEQARGILASLDGLADALVSKRPDDVTVVLTSDHGNMEDLSTKSHTRNPVPLAVLGPGSDRFATVKDLTGVTPAVMDVLGLG